jgi:hypothetical protein
MPDLRAIDDPGPPTGAEVVDSLGQGPQSHVRADSASPLGKQRPHITDGPGDGGTVHAELAGQHIMSDTVTEMDESGQEPVGEHQLVLSLGAYGPLPWSRGQLDPVTLLPRRTYLSDKFSDHSGRQTRDPVAADDHCTRRVPSHPTMINHPGLGVSPLTVHELVRSGATAPIARIKGAHSARCCRSRIPTH